VIEVLNSFWALEFGGTVLKVIWVSGPRQTDAQTSELIYRIINLPWNERRAHIWIGHCTFFHLNFVYECGMDQKYMCFGIKKQLQIIYAIWCIHCIYITIWNFDHLITLKWLQIELVINHFMYLDCLFTFWPFDWDGNLKMFP
jgi:hypothetical protein